ncbi:tyrosine phosphatase family protein [Pararhizobium sp.]|uniref:tyrosine phosphatase family protein n=1 Tax=Pararhizobium sp. TaxID=1977563 RepID=UPI003D0CBF8D
MNFPALTICGIEELPAQRDREVTHVLSILDPDHPEIGAFEAYPAHCRTTLRFHDIIDPEPNKIMPQSGHVNEIIRLGESLKLRTADAESGHFLVHCHKGVSRSTAAMLTLLATGNPQEDSESLFRRLAEIRPQAWPSSLMVRLADEQLDRGGSLIAALRRHYGRQIVARPYYIDFIINIGRRAEVEMAEMVA